MGWSGRAPAPPASEAGKGRQRQGARHVSDTQYRDGRDRHRYRQELTHVPTPQTADIQPQSQVEGNTARQCFPSGDLNGTTQKNSRLLKTPSATLYTMQVRTRVTWCIKVNVAACLFGIAAIIK